MSNFSHIRIFTAKRSGFTYVYIALGLIVAIIMIVVIVVPHLAFGATRTWDNDSADGLWSTCANWSDNTCPESADTVVFNGTSDTDSTVDSSFAGTVGAVQINSGYNSTITFERSLTVDSSGGWSQADGITRIEAFDLSLTSSLGDFNVTGGEFHGTTTTIALLDDLTIGAAALITLDTATTTFSSSSIDSDFTCTGTYPGVIDINKTNAGADFTLASGCAITFANTIAPSTVGTITLNGPVTTGESIIIDGGSTTGAGNIVINDAFDASSLTTFSIEGSVTVSDVSDLTSFTATTTFYGGHSNNDSTLSCSGTYPSVVDLTSTATADFTLSSNCIITLANTIAPTQIGTITLNGTTTPGTTITLDGGSIVGAGSMIINNDFNSASLTHITLEGDLTVTNTSDLNDFTATTTFNGNHSNNDSTFSCTGTYPGVVDFTTTSGFADFTLGSGCTITLANTIAPTQIGAVTFNGALTTGTTITLDGNGSTVGADVTISDTFNATALTTFSIEGDLTIGDISDLTNFTATTTFAGNHSNNDAVLTCTGTYPGQIDITKTNSGASYTLASGCSALSNQNISSSGSITINGTLDTQGYNLSGSAITVGSTGTLQLDGNQTITVPTLTPGSTVEYTGASTYTELLLGDSYSNLSFSGSGTYTLDADLTVASDLTISSGTLDASATACTSASCDITVTGDWSNSGTFTPRTGDVILNGFSQQVLGSTTFYDFTKSTSTTDTITFEAGERQTITNTLTLNGAESNLLSLRSTSAETAWEIDPQGTRTIAYLDVQDSNNVNASAIDASDGTNVDSDRNTNWSFGAEGGGSEQTARTQTRGGHFRFFGGSLIIR